MSGPATGGSPDPRPAPGLTSGGPYRYARWDGRQQIDEIDADRLMDMLSDDLLTESDLDGALARLLNRGVRDEQGRGAIPGLDQMLRRLAAAREDLLAQHRLGDVLADVRQELDEIVAQERRGIERRLTSGSGAPEALDELAADLATRRQEQLAALPDDLGGRIRGLSDYDFLEPDARRRFDELMDTLRRQVLDAHFEGLADAIRDATPEQLAANREMVRELNRSAAGASRRRATRTCRASCRATAASSRARRRSTTSSTSSPNEWPRCSR